MKRAAPLILLLILSLFAGCSSGEKPTNPNATAIHSSDATSGSVGGPNAMSAPTSPAPGQPGQPGEAAPAEEPDPEAWPRAITRDKVTYTVYQPQLDSWDGIGLVCRAAVSVLPEGGKEPTYGIIHMTAETTVDREERMVHFENPTVTETQFPSLSQTNA
ncbi:MAG TPA: hypothetical protein VFJ90_10165, partial [Candidatus Didemnitutus sp.]|nr:hypothetical protein [Candidatus Didemnitutus sp.]